LDEGAPIAAPRKPPATADAWRIELLDLAFDAASAFPLYPHIKNRSRAQADPAHAALEIDQPDLALSYADGIVNWRRGEAIAAVAQHEARLGRLERVEDLLRRAQDIADGKVAKPEELAAAEGIETAQEWHRDRIRARIAATYLILGRTNLADAAAFDAQESEKLPIHVQRASQVSGEQFDAFVTRLDGYVTVGTFDSLSAALASYAELYDRFYANRERRDALEAKVRIAWAKLPVQVRVETTERLVESALRAQDRERAVALLDEMRELLDSMHWTADAVVPLRARLASLRARAVDTAAGRAEADAALATYHAGRAQVVNMDRADTLRPLAETYADLGDARKARELYALALTEALENPNSRPRTDDFVAVLCSLVVHGIEPDEALSRQIREFRGKLGEPW
jgi:hypothetical protein